MFDTKHVDILKVIQNGFRSTLNVFFQLLQFLVCTIKILRGYRSLNPPLCNTGTTILPLFLLLVGLVLAFRYNIISISFAWLLCNIRFLQQVALWVKAVIELPSKNSGDQTPGYSHMEDFHL